MNKNGIIPIVFAIDDNYAPMVHVTIRSIMANASPDYEYHIHIMYENLSDAWKKSLQSMATEKFQIQFNFVGDVIKKYEETMHYKYYGSNAIYYRVFIPELFPQYKKAIYLDADVVLNADISEFYNTDLGDNYVGGVLCEIVNYVPVFMEYSKTVLGFDLSKPSYFNSGVLLMNCEKMRQDHFIKRFFEIANRFKLELCPDQDYYNLLCYGKSVILPAEWNKMPVAGSKQKLADLKLVHFNVSGKPWQQKNVLYGELFWQHAVNTPVYELLKQMRENATDGDAGADKVDLLATVAQAEAARNTNLLAIIRREYH